MADDQIAILTRIVGSVGGGLIIMLCAGWYSWRNRSNVERFYGGLLGGLLLSGGLVYWLFLRPLLG